MIEPSKMFGRLGNQLFKEAFLYSYAKDNNVDPYFQDPKYFDKYSEEIKQMYGEGIGFLPFIGIHVRRGDYVGNPFYCQLWETDYYERAIGLFPNEKFLVLSDDVEWCKNKWGDNKDFQVMEGTELEDFNMFASCKGQIISNSSFSWWGAFLCPNYAHKVIAPRKDRWYADNQERTKCPSNWIRL